MSITANTLYRDSVNFLRHQFVSILLLSLVTAFISVVLNQAFRPDAEQLSMLSSAGSDGDAISAVSVQELIRSMDPDQLRVLLKASAAASFSALIGNLLLVGGLITLIQMVSQGQRTSALRAIGASAPMLPRLLLLLFVCTLLIQFGLTLFVIPGIALTVAFSLAPVISANEKTGLFASLKLSSKLAYANIKLVVPAMLLWMVAKLVLLFLAGRLSFISDTAIDVVIGGLSNLVSAVLLVYLFRLYMLLRN